MEIRINAERLYASLSELAQIGATPGGGVTRLALSEEDKAGRDLLRRWFTEAGLDVRVDDLGNMTGHRAGKEPGLPLLLGSHCDSVVRGGKFDGALGVMGALEVMRTLNDHGIQTTKPLAVVNWTNEEGVRFEPAMTCAGVAAGRFTRDFVYDRTDRQGLRFEDELRRIGYLGDEASRPLPAAAYLELHIEQGPVLDDEELPVGVVDGIVGITWSEVTIEGQADHAGPSPMRLRRDALVAAAIVIEGVEHLAKQKDEQSVATVGRLVVEPNVINTIPGKVTFSVDFRHSDPAVLEGQVENLRSMIDQVAAERGVAWSLNPFWTSEPTPFAPAVVEAVEKSCEDLDLPVRHLWSGAGHDAKYVADVCPAGMIFVRSRGGLSHCEEELSAPEDIEAGANVLLHAALALADAI
jgi:N-carbamoyl-L-amino-acid hydrolase